MKAIIFHGTDCKPEDFWYGWLQKKLEAKGYTAEVPYYPSINKEPVEETINKVLDDHDITEDTILIGHSSGVPLILAMLEKLENPVWLAVFVAGFSEEIGGPGDPILKPAYNWDKIKANAKDFIIINSDNDPWGCDDKQGRKLFDKLGGTQIIQHDGHFGSQSQNQPYKEFPLLNRLIPETS
jgi:predicted alpha/beta hydrolase family esterase